MFEDGVWRTVAGRRIFIKNGQSLSDAMKKSGKFKTKKEQLEYLNKKYKNDLMYPIEQRRTRKYIGFGAGLKDNPYETTYHAKLKNNYDIFKKDLNELDDEIDKIRKK